MSVRVWLCLCVHLIEYSDPADQTSRNLYEHFATGDHCEVKFRPVESDYTDEQECRKRHFMLRFALSTAEVSCEVVQIVGGHSYERLKVFCLP